MTSKSSARLTLYERRQITQTEAWRHEEPSVLRMVLNIPVEPVASLARKVVPDNAIMTVLSASNWAARKMTRTGGVRRDANVWLLGDLIGKDLGATDREPVLRR
jgi:hypothetical protein